MIHRLRTLLLDQLPSLLVKFVLPKAKIDIQLPSVKCAEKKNQKADGELIIGSQIREFITANTESQEQGAHDSGSTDEKLPKLSDGYIKSFYCSICVYYTIAID